jgi:hypothetical protein
MENQFNNKFYSKYFSTKLNAQNIINYFQTQNLIQNLNFLKNSNTFLFSLPQNNSENCLSFYQSSVEELSKKLNLLFGLEQIRMLSSLGLINQGKL